MVDWNCQLIPVCQSHLVCDRGQVYLGQLLVMAVCVLAHLSNVAVSGAGSVAGGLALALDRLSLNVEVAHDATLVSGRGVVLNFYKLQNTLKVGLLYCAARTTINIGWVSYSHT